MTTATIEIPTYVTDPVRNGMTDGGQVGGADEYTDNPFLGLLVTDFDCDSTESWVLITHHPDRPTFLVELVEFWSPSYHGGHWTLVEVIEVAHVADAASEALYLHDDYLAQLAARNRED